MDGKQKIDVQGTALRDMLPELEVNAVGVISVDDRKGTKLEQTARELLPGVRSVVVLAMEIYPEVLDLVSPGRTTGAASTNDLLNTHTDYLSGRLNKASYDIARALRSAGWKTLPMPSAGCPMDTRFLEAVFSYKHAGQAAGLGTFGWHSLLITPEFGPRARLACCLTEAGLEATLSVNTSVDCASCGRCTEICPARALSAPPKGEPYAINKFACSAFRAASGGCSECMRVCPVGR